MATAKVTTHISANHRSTRFSKRAAPPINSAGSEWARTIMSSRPRSRADVRIKYVAVAAMTPNVTTIMIASGRPIRISRAATLTLAKGTKAIAERNEIPGMTDASAGTRLTR